MILKKNKFGFKILFYCIIMIFLKSNNILGYFHIRLGEKENISKYQIKIIDINEIANKWITNEPPTQVYDINIEETEDMKLFLKELKNLDTNLKNHIPGYNAFNTNSLNYISLKNPPKELLGIYIVPRNNPFKKKYPDTQYSTTLEELLNNNKISMKEIYCFWNVKTKSQDPPNVAIHHIYGSIFEGKEEDYHGSNTINRYINHYNKYIRNKCYNMTLESGIIIPLPDESLFNGLKITHIYFDNGIRIIKKGTTKDLLKMANGAKNIYVFSLEYIPKNWAPHDYNFLNRSKFFDKLFQDHPGPEFFYQFPPGDPRQACPIFKGYNYEFIFKTGEYKNFNLIEELTKQTR
ncbi:hypothetical protein [Columbia Basin potato purple top phytoplasma]|uniref:Uncharacterized protein n=1 Tax=Columbia Basin potato purple top phytoplasma TaxID=307134 RepID=A0ABT5L8X9_9MOLU|nr:hypothetical protein [Columbia Basin potato purple top phytoplasma]MDC9032077.1 hypothetical protein [Columbia Basin potato purple top phytoplasma]